MAEAVAKEAKTASSGNNDMLVKAIVLWLLAPLGSLFYMNETDSFVKFSVKQALYYGIARIVVYTLLSVTVVLACLLPIVFIADTVLVIYMIIKTKDGVKVKLPVIGDMVEKSAA